MSPEQLNALANGDADKITMREAAVELMARGTYAEELAKEYMTVCTALRSRGYPTVAMLAEDRLQGIKHKHGIGERVPEGEKRAAYECGWPQCGCSYPDTPPCRAEHANEQAASGGTEGGKRGPCEHGVSWGRPCVDCERAASGGQRAGLSRDDDGEDANRYRWLRKHMWPDSSDREGVEWHALLPDDSVRGEIGLVPRCLDDAVDIGMRRAASAGERAEN